MKRFTFAALSVLFFTGDSALAGINVKPYKVFAITAGDTETKTTQIELVEETGAKYVGRLGYCETVPETEKQRMTTLLTMAFMNDMRIFADLKMAKFADPQCLLTVQVHSYDRPRRP